MNKILVIISVPMLEEEYDVYIPVSKSIKVTIELIVKTINELSLGYFPLKKDCVLLSSNGEMFDKNYTIKDCGIKNGDKLILV